MFVPPLGDPWTSVRQPGDEIRDRNARFLERPAVIDELTNLAGGVDSESRKRYDHRSADKSCEQDRQNLSCQSGRHLPANAFVERPERDREHYGPSQSAQIIRQYVEARTHQDCAKEQPCRALPPRTSFGVGQIRNLRAIIRLHGIVTLLKEEHYELEEDSQNSASRIFSSGHDCLAPHIHRRCPKGSVRLC